MCFAQWNLNSKNRDFPQGKRYFLQNPRFCFEVEIDGKHEKNENKSLENQLFFWTSIVEGFWANLAGFWASSWAPKVPAHPGFFARCVQEAPKRLLRAPSVPQERPKRCPRASPERLRVYQERSKLPKIAQVAQNRWKFAKIVEHRGKSHEISENFCK